MALLGIGELWKFPFPMPCLLHKIQVHGKSYRGLAVIIDLAERRIASHISMAAWCLGTPSNMINGNFKDTKFSCDVIVRIHIVGRPLTLQTLIDQHDNDMIRDMRMKIFQNIQFILKITNNTNCKCVRGNHGNIISEKNPHWRLAQALSPPRGPSESRINPSVTRRLEKPPVLPIWKEIPSRKLTYPTLGKGKSSSKCHFWGIC